MLPEFLESPLDTDLDDVQLDWLSKHRAEHRLSRRHIVKLAPAQCNYRVFPQFYIRASFKAPPIVALIPLYSPVQHHAVALSRQ